MLLIDAYCNRLILGNYRPATVTIRRRVLRSFAATLPEGHQVQDATRLNVEAYLARPLAPESRRAYRSHLRAFYTWAADEGYLTGTDPTLKLPAVRIPRAVPRPIHDDDLRKAVRLADPRMRAWLLLMALAGLRCIEVAALRPEDVSATAGGPLLYLRECKGGGTATVPAHEAVLAALVQLPVRDRLWWSCSTAQVSKLVAAHLRSVGVEATAHRLRHWAGTEWYRASGHDVITTALLLRHASIRTTQTYAATDPARPAHVVRLVLPPTRALGSAS